MKPLFSAAASVVLTAGHAFLMAGECDSPIETMLGAPLRATIRRRKLPLYVIPQFVFGPYRYDFAVQRWDGVKLAFIECDGREFHSTEEQKANDLKKDRLAAKSGIRVIRFTGSEINRDGAKCVEAIIKRVGFA